MLYEIHMLKNYPPTNLNRDETGAPKTCTFGGTTRGRISSQCLKRSWRTSEIFKSAVSEENIGFRTQKLPELVANRLLERGVAKDFVETITPKISGLGNSKGDVNKKDPKKTAQVMFFSKEDIASVAEAVKNLLDRCKSVAEVKKIAARDILSVIKDAKTRAITLDIALFGRMVTSEAFRNVEASMQVAHAISTNKITVETDYFTAMDDLLGGESMEETRADHINDTDYNASCYYIYASLDTDALRDALKDAENVDQIIAAAIPALLRAMAFTNPSGKQNSFAGHVLPSCVMVECKDKKVPTSLVNAFVEPVQGRDVVKESVRKLAEEADMLSRNFGLPVRERLWFCVDKYDVRPECATKVCAAFPELVEAAAALLK